MLTQAVLGEGRARCTSSWPSSMPRATIEVSSGPRKEPGEHGDNVDSHDGKGRAELTDAVSQPHGNIAWRTALHSEAARLRPPPPSGTAGPDPDAEHPQHHQTRQLEEVQ